MLLELLSQSSSLFLLMFGWDVSESVYDFLALGFPLFDVVEIFVFVSFLHDALLSFTIRLTNAPTATL